MPFPERGPLGHPSVLPDPASESSRFFLRSPPGGAELYPVAACTASESVAASA
jgi:hypothetical protein